MTSDHKKSVLFVINPFAGHQSQSKVPSIIQSEIDDSLFNVFFEETQYSGHASELAQKAKDEGLDAIVAVGGDGTVNEIASELVYSDLALGIIPAGSGNGLSTHLGIGRNARKAVRILQNFRVKSIDTASVNGKFFVNMAGIGLDGLVAYKTKNSQNRGFTTYLRGALTEAIKYKNQTYKVQIGDNEFEGKFLSINVANGSMFGYNFTIAADADTTDGLIDALMIHDAHKMDYFGNAWRFWAGRIHKSKFASLNKAPSLKVTSFDDNYIHIDGEGYSQQAGELEFEVLHKSLRIIC